MFSKPLALLVLALALMVSTASGLRFRNGRLRIISNPLLHKEIRAGSKTNLPPAQDEDEPTARPNSAIHVTEISVRDA